MEIKEIKESKLKTILHFSIPSIIAMLLETVITITDGYFTMYPTSCSQEQTYQFITVTEVY